MKPRKMAGPQPKCLSTTCYYYLLHVRQQFYTCASHHNTFPYCPLNLLNYSHISHLYVYDQSYTYYYCKHPVLTFCIIYQYIRQQFSCLQKNRHCSLLRFASHAIYYNKVKGTTINMVTTMTRVDNSFIGTFTTLLHIKEARNVFVVILSHCRRT